MLAYVHIPKNAGQTMMRVLAMNFPGTVQWFYTDRKGRFLEDEEFLQLVRGLPADTQALSGHDFRPLPADVARAHGIQYFTLIRQPVARLISLYHYEKKMYPDAPVQQLPFKEYVALRKTEDLALHSFQCLNLCAEGTAEAAIERLEQFAVVGLTERFDDSLELLKHKLNWPDFKIQCERQNVSAEELNVGDLEPALRAELEEMNREDMKLYQYATARFNREFAQLMPAGMHRAG